MADEKHYGSARVENTKSIKNGLVFRPLKNTVIDTLNWFKSENFDSERRKEYLGNENMLINREKQLLSLWKEFKNN